MDEDDDEGKPLIGPAYGIVVPKAGGEYWREFEKYTKANGNGENNGGQESE